MTDSSTILGIQTLLIPVSDVAAAKATYTALLGAGPSTDSDYYVGFDAAGQQIGLLPGGGPQGLTAPQPSWHVTDLEGVLAAIEAAGATITAPPREVGGGRRVASFTDADGNSFGLIQD
jgi:predicted enzyme related to lactoylglutathione lyase